MEKSFNLSDAMRDYKNSALLMRIFDYLGRISEERDLDTVLYLLADLGREIIEAERCTLWLFDDDKQIIYTKVAHGVDHLTVKKGEGLVGYAIETGEELIINDPYNDPRFNADTDKETGYETREIIVIPVFNNNGEVIAAFQALNKVPKGASFTQDDLNHLRMVATYSGKTLETAMLNYEIEETQRELIYILGESCELRSHETGNHVRRVSKYATLIAEGLNLPDKDINIIKSVTPLHD